MHVRTLRQQLLSLLWRLLFCGAVIGLVYIYEVRLHTLERRLPALATQEQLAPVVRDVQALARLLDVQGTQTVRLVGSIAEVRQYCEEVATSQLRRIAQLEEAVAARMGREKHKP